MEGWRDGGCEHAGIDGAEDMVIEPHLCVVRLWVRGQR